MELRAPPMTPTAASKAPFVLPIIVAQALIGAALAAVIAWRLPTPARSADTTELRTIASKLQAAGALNEAAALYERYLDANPDVSQRGSIAYSLGSLYLDGGQYEKALRWLYDAEAHNKGDLGEELGKKIVHTLEGMGRPFAARAALTAQTRLDANPAAQHAADDPVVAKVGDTSVYRSDITRALDDLPPELGKHFAGAEGQAQFLRKYVADELFLRKAEKLEYDRDAEVRRSLDTLRRQLVVGKFLDRELFSKIAVSHADLETYFTANKEKYKADSLDKVRPQVERDYRLMKSQAAYNDMIGKELASEGVQLFADKLTETHK